MLHTNVFAYTIGEGIRKPPLSTFLGVTSLLVSVPELQNQDKIAYTLKPVICPKYKGKKKKLMLFQMESFLLPG